MYFALINTDIILINIKIDLVEKDKKKKGKTLYLQASDDVQFKNKK